MSTFVDPEKEINIFLKITILREKRKVLFAEGNKDFVDGLFGSMLFPTSAMLERFPDAFPPCLYNIRRSIQEIPEYFSPLKEFLLTIQPETRRCTYKHILFHSEEKSGFSADSSSSTSDGIFVCRDCVGKVDGPINVAEKPTVLCLKCNQPMDQITNYCNTPQEKSIGAGFVNGECKYFITDNLEIQPILTLSCATKLLIEAQGLGEVEEITIDSTHKKEVMVEVFKAAVYGSTVLSDAFFSTGLLEKVTTYTA